MPAASTREPRARERLYLIDGYSTIFRAFYAIRDLSTSRGEPTNALYGFINMLRKLLREHQPELVGIAFDVAGKTVRAEKFEQYKANRTPMPDDLKVQMPLIRRAIDAFGIPLVEQKGYEADDVLGTLARRAVVAGYDVVLVTADKDLFQLVSDHVSLYHSGREKLYDRAAVAEDFGVPPERVVDVLALQGDAIDNIPGVPGIGEKGAKALIAEWGSLENLLDHAAELKRKTYREALTSHRDQARLSKELVTIHTDLDLGFDESALRLTPPDQRALYQLYGEFEFTTLRKELEVQGLRARLELAPARGLADAAAWQAAAAAAGNPVCVALVGGAGGGLPLGFAIEGPDAPLFADLRQPGMRDAVLAVLRQWLGDRERTLVGHDLKEVLRFAGLGDRAHPLRARLDDTMLLAYLLPPALRGYELADVAFDRLQHMPMSAQDAGSERGAEPLPHDPRLLAWAGELAALPGLLHQRLLPEASAGRALAVYRQLEEPLLPVLLRMEEAGILLDGPFLRGLARRMNAEIAELEEEIYRLAGERFNLNSPQQLGEILFERLGYQGGKRTKKTRQYSTSAETLQELAQQGHDLPQKLLRYRELQKLSSTYVEALPEQVDAAGRLHTRYYQAVAATGRISSANPNLQNIPVRTAEGQEIRRAFCAPGGHLLLVADYSQIELRVLAHIAQERALIEAFNTPGTDIHRATAASVFGVDPALVNDEQRRAAKVINFGIIYGMSPFGLAQNLGIAPADAKVFIEAYFARYPGVRAYTEQTLRAAEAEGCVSTLYGRARYLPELRSKNWNLRENAKRMAINARIQGTAADLLKLAMIAVDRLLAERHPGARLLLTVHDELVLEGPEAEAEEIAAAVRAAMEGVAELAVPLQVDAGCGRTWYDAKA